MKQPQLETDHPTQPNSSKEPGSTQIRCIDGPSITPSLLFTEEEVLSVNWEEVWEEW